MFYKKIRSVLLLLVLFSTAATLFCGCSEYTANQEDFRLAISLSPEEMGSDEKIVVHAEFKNLSSHTLRITASSEADESLIRIYYSLKGQKPDMTDVSVACKTFLQKDAVIEKEVTLADLAAGEYEVFAYVGFYQNDNFIGIESDKLTFKIT